MEAEGPWGTVHESFPQLKAHGTLGGSPDPMGSSRSNTVHWDGDQALGLLGLKWHRVRAF